MRVNAWGAISWHVPTARVRLFEIVEYPTDRAALILTSSQALDGCLSYRELGRKQGRTEIPDAGQRRLDCRHAGRP